MIDVPTRLSLKKSSLTNFNGPRSGEKAAEVPIWWLSGGNRRRVPIGASSKQGTRMVGLANKQAHTQPYTISSYKALTINPRSGEMRGGGMVMRVEFWKGEKMTKTCMTACLQYATSYLQASPLYSTTFLGFLPQ